MKKTTVQYFCDRCGEEISDISQTEDGMMSLDAYGQSHPHARVSIQYTYNHSIVAYQESMLCDKCKIKVLEDVLKKLKERSRRNG